MKRMIALLLVILTAPVAASCASPAAPDASPTEAPTVAVITDETRAELAEEFESLFAQRLYEGAAYVVYQGEAVYAGGTGKANKDEGTDNGADVVYSVGSVTKQFTAAAILKLCEEGKLSLDDTLEKYYPDYPAGKDITIHSLLSMQSGIPDYSRSYDEDGYEISVSSSPYIAGTSETNSAQQNRKVLQEYIFAFELLFEQGDRYSYSNSNYFLLGGIVEQVSGVSYHDYVRENFFVPLGMDTAGFVDDYDHPDAVIAKGYHRASNASLIFAYDGVSFACGDVMASPKDMEKWTVALHGGKVLEEEWYRLMTTPYIEDEASGASYGYGLMIADLSDARMYFHPGSIPGFVSFVGYIPDQDYYIAMMSNYANENTATIAMKMTRLFAEAIRSE